MKKYEILYDWPMAEITRLADSNEAEQFAESLNGSHLDSFIALSEQLRGLGVDLARAKADRQFFGKWEELRVCLKKYEEEFDSFPSFSPKKFALSILLSAKLTQAAPLLDSDDIDETLFEIRTLPTPVPLFWFSHENMSSFPDSLAVFSCADPGTLNREITAATLSPRFIFHFLAVLHSLAEVPASHAVLIKKTSPSIDASAVEGFARLLILASGKPVHSVNKHTGGLSVIDKDEISAGELYQQWNDLFNVLSEYNSRDEILLKYLTIYHAIENFMFKVPIVDLQRQVGNRMFSIRDFRRLYRRVEVSEGNALKSLFTAVFQLQATTGNDFEQHIMNRWNALVPRIAEADLNDSMSALGLTFNYAGFASQPATYFGQLVYSIRNAIVHNKETEFHLTYASMDNVVNDLIVEFLMPSLEEITFSLISKPNAETWYSKKELYFYQ